MVDHAWVRQRIEGSEYYFSKHADQERQNDNLTIQEIEEAIINGRLIEQYANTGRGESCLIAGFTNNGIPIHAVCGQRNNWAVIITVYIPSPPKFKSPYERA